MHELYEFACDELKELERKAGDKNMTAADLEYANKLSELKKNILKIEMLEDQGYSAADGDDMSRNMRSHRYNGGRSYARGRMNARRDSMGRYSRSGYSMDAEDLIEQLEDMKESAPDDMSRREIGKLIDKMRNA